MGGFLEPLQSCDRARISRNARIRILLVSIAGSLLMVGSRAGAQETHREIPRLPLTGFYDTARPLPPGKPGELIRSALFEEYNLPPEVEAVRFLYHSRSAAGNDVAASGVVLYPDREPPAEGWPVIAWAHEFRGAARQCAPSLLRNPEHGPFLTMYVGLGYAVVVPDYTGLGTSFPNPGPDIPSSAADVIDSIAAARRAVRGLSPRWVAMGTAEGALAVIGVAEADEPIKEPKYLGSIALSGLTELDDGEAMGRSSYSWPLVLAYATKRIYPEFEESDILTREGLSSYARFGTQCGAAEASQTSLGRLVKPNWHTNRFVESYLRRNRLGLRPARGPLLILMSSGDSSLPSTRSIVRRLCGQRDRLQFEVYPGSDPGRLIGDSVRDQIAWIQARFSAQPAPTNCSSQP